MRPATAPETMVAAVAAGNLGRSSPAGSGPRPGGYFADPKPPTSGTRGMICGAPLHDAEADEPVDYDAQRHVQKVLEHDVDDVFDELKPSSTRAKPACIKSTSTAQIKERNC